MHIAKLIKLKIHIVYCAKLNIQHHELISFSLFACSFEENRNATSILHSTYQPDEIYSSLYMDALASRWQFEFLL